MLASTWKLRGHFPGFSKLLQIMLGNRYNPEKFINELKENEEEDNYYKILIELIKNPRNTPTKYQQYKSFLFELRDEIMNRDLTIEDFLVLTMLDLTHKQFERIFKGINGLTPKNVASNPYLLFEEYEPGDIDEDEYLGNKIDGRIDLYKIDIAYFPDRQFLDKIEDIQNIKIDDVRRVRALIIKYLESLEGKGDCFDEAEAIFNYIKEYPLFYRMFEKNTEYRINEDLRNISDEYSSHLLEKLVIKKDNSSQHCYYYLKEIYQAETYLKSLVLKWLKEPDFDFDYGDFTNEITTSVKLLKQKLGKNFNSDEFYEERKHLYANVFKKHFFILAGAPGSGKSHELLRIIKTLRSHKESCLVLTPTGKAALRLNSDINYGKFAQAMTIDKFLNSDDYKTLVWSNVIIDEASMVDLLKFYKLIQSLNINKVKRLILVGDQNQLPPIGFGKVFADIIHFITMHNEYKNNISSLRVNCRQEMDEIILDCAKIFSNENKNYEELLNKLSQVPKNGKLSKGLYVFCWKNRDELYDKLLNQLKVVFHSGNKNLNNLLYEIFGLDSKGNVDEENFQSSLKVDSFQIITPYRTSFFGTLGINNLFQEKLKKDEKFISNGSIFKHSDKVILVKNIYSGRQLILSNGSIGIVTKGGWFYFPESNERTKNVDIENCELAYAITVHKSQGSGFQHIFVVIPEKTTLLSRELLYTALTRSRESVSLFIYGENNKPIEESILYYIRNRSFVDYRKTSLFEEPVYGYSYFPDEGIQVKSRVEYIIFKKLQELREKNKNFNFSYESEYKVKSKPFVIHPDFTIHLSDGRKIYWEHLGKLFDKKYINNWIERYNFYKENGDDKNLITTDELGGINDKKIELIVEDIINRNLKGDAIVKYSRYHYSLA